MQHAVDGAQQRGPRLVVEDDDHAGRGEGGTPAEFALHAPEGGEKNQQGITTAGTKRDGPTGGFT